MAKHMTDSNSTPTHEQITQRAYEIFMERGQPAGQDLAHWLEAEKQLSAAGQKAQKATATAQTSTGSQVAAAAIRQPEGNGRAQGNGNGRTARAAARK
jgi:hypothetical protein